MNDSMYELLGPLQYYGAATEVHSDYLEKNSYGIRLRVLTHPALK